MLWGCSILVKKLNILHYPRNIYTYITIPFLRIIMVESNIIKMKNRKLFRGNMYHVSVVFFSRFFFTSKGNMILLIPDKLKIIIIRKTISNTKTKRKYKKDKTVKPRRKHHYSTPAKFCKCFRFNDTSQNIYNTLNNLRYTKANMEKGSCYIKVMKYDY